MDEESKSSISQERIIIPEKGELINNRIIMKPKENEISNYILRFFIISQMDFQYSFLEMVMLLIHPKKE